MSAYLKNILQAGMETVLAESLLEISRKTHEDLGIKTYHIPFLPRRIYIEAPGILEIQQLMKFSAYSHLVSRATRIPDDINRSFLHSTNAPDVPCDGSWVRIIQPGIYKGDLAVVSRVMSMNRQLQPILYHYFSRPVPYVQTWALQERIHQLQLHLRQLSNHSDVLLLLQHRPTYTAGIPTTSVVVVLASFPCRLFVFPAVLVSTVDMISYGKCEIILKTVVSTPYRQHRSLPSQ